MSRLGMDELMILDRQSRHVDAEPDNLGVKRGRRLGRDSGTNDFLRFLEPAIGLEPMTC
jgi:hypothetical protein